jgi:succinoglycan biosynthesis protein ExoL
MSTRPSRTAPPRAVFISTASSQPRYHRRVRAFLQAGYRVTVYTFRRQFYPVNLYPEGCELIDLGEMSDGRLLARIPRLVAAITSIRRMERSKLDRPAVVYGFGMDAALLGFTIRGEGVRHVYEVGDIRMLRPGASLSTGVLGWIEKRMLRSIDALVVTAPDFLSRYFAALSPGIESRALVCENRLSGEHFTEMERPRPVTPGIPIRIGFVGLLLYPDPFGPLLDAVAASGGEFEFHVYGDGPLRRLVEEYAGRHENIHYHGSFKSPEDLAEIYHSIDINYVVYDNRDPNVRLLLPNKLYESLFFGIPVVVAADTAAARRVDAFGAGIVVDPTVPGFAEALLTELTPESITTWSERALDISPREFVEDPRETMDALHSLLGLRGPSWLQGASH